MFWSRVIVPQSHSSSYFGKSISGITPRGTWKIPSHSTHTVFSSTCNNGYKYYIWNLKFCWDKWCTSGNFCDKLYSTNCVQSPYSDTSQSHIYFSSPSILSHHFFSTVQPKQHNKYKSATAT